jgi:hypothetical protein
MSSEDTLLWVWGTNQAEAMRVKQCANRHWAGSRSFHRRGKMKPKCNFTTYNCGAYPPALTLPAVPESIMDALHAGVLVKPGGLGDGDEYEADLRAELGTGVVQQARADA